MEFTIDKPQAERMLSKVLASIKQRCYNPRRNNYKYYGEKGVGVCIEWLSDKQAFINWSLDNCWKPGLTIDRIDSEKGYRGYSPENCRFVTQAENSRNIALQIKLYDTNCRQFLSL